MKESHKIIRTYFFYSVNLLTLGNLFIYFKFPAYSPKSIHFIKKHTHAQHYSYIQFFTFLTHMQRHLLTHNFCNYML